MKETKAFHAHRLRLAAMYDSGYDAALRGLKTGEAIIYPSGYSRRERVGFVAGMQYVLTHTPHDRQPWLRFLPPLDTPTVAR